jgi:hypothetical protein
MEMRMKDMECLSYIMPKRDKYRDTEGDKGICKGRVGKWLYFAAEQRVGPSRLATYPNQSYTPVSEGELHILSLKPLTLIADFVGEAGTHRDSPGKESWN